MRPRESYLEILALREKCGIDFFEKHHSRFVNVPCPVCSSQGVAAFEKYGYAHKKCETCSTIWCSERPTEELLGEYYAEWDAPKYWTRLLINTEVERKALQYAPRVEKIVSVHKAHGGGTSRAADLGAGSGAFAKALLDSGFFNEVVAVDFSDDCVAACSKLGITAIKGSVQDISEVDILTMNDLIEHVFDPISFIKSCHAALNDGGFIAIACPNGEGFDFSIMKEKTVNITPPEHLNYFNPFSMTRLLEENGFEVVSIETPGILDVQIVLRALKDGVIEMTDNLYLKNLILDGDEKTLEDFQGFLAANKLSSHMLAIARKK